MACPICFELISKNNIATSKCGHTTCLSCLLEHLKYNNLCPLCRYEIEEERTNKLQSEFSLEQAKRIAEETILQLQISEKLQQYGRYNVEIEISQIETIIRNSISESIFNTLSNIYGEDNMHPSWFYDEPVFEREELTEDFYNEEYNIIHQTYINLCIQYAEMENEFFILSSNLKIANMDLQRALIEEDNVFSKKYKKHEFVESCLNTVRIIEFKLEEIKINKEKIYNEIQNQIQLLDNFKSE